MTNMQSKASPVSYCTEDETGGDANTRHDACRDPQPAHFPINSTKRGHASVTMSAQLQANFAKLSKRKRLDLPPDDKLALETVSLVQKEVSELRRSVAELEALLMAYGEPLEAVEFDDNDDLFDDENVKIAFPNLPRVVIVPELDDAQSEQGRLTPS
jgi:hypothetical protein|mmetsp:Transcript_39076/g.102443  ORF Transcript_39076/g.102443 Transcript_39076/m.102443 type:complete len:157 (+) Transcript_39076:726-1196(+)